MEMKTQSGTYLADGIEYNEYPPTNKLIKVMHLQWAMELIQNGLIRFRNLEYYRQWENAQLGDPNDGNGLYHLDGHPMQAGSVNDVFAWCLSLPEISKARLLEMAKPDNYDCIITIKAPEEMFRRIQRYLQQNSRGFSLHCGRVRYDRGSEVDKVTLNAQKFHYNVFQKAARFQEDKEYRVSIVDYAFIQTSVVSNK